MHCDAVAIDTILSTSVRFLRERVGSYLERERREILTLGIPRLMSVNVGFYFVSCPFFGHRLGLARTRAGREEGRDYSGVVRNYVPA